MIDFVRKGKNTSDATATSDDIISPKTAYVNGEKITGNIEATEGVSVVVKPSRIEIPTTSQLVLQLPDNVFIGFSEGNLNVLKNDTIKTITNTISGTIRKVDYYDMKTYCYIAILSALNNTAYLEVLKFDYTTMDIQILYNQSYAGTFYYSHLGLAFANTHPYLAIYVRQGASGGKLWTLKIENDIISVIKDGYVVGSGEFDVVLIKWTYDDTNIIASCFGYSRTYIISLNEGVPVSQTLLSEKIRADLTSDNSYMYKCSSNGVITYGIWQGGFKIDTILTFDTKVNDWQDIHVIDNSNFIILYGGTYSRVYANTGETLKIIAQIDSHAQSADNDISYQTWNRKLSYFNVGYVNYSNKFDINFSGLKITSLIRNNITYYDTLDSTVNINDVLSTKISYGPAGKIIGTMPNNGDVTIIPSTEQQVKNPGYYNTLKIEAVTSAIDTNILPENIKAGVTILGVTGIYTGEEEAPVPPEAETPPDSE